MKRGFTLIELLVVVLIIGILAAIAVPQYQKAVLKSRFSSLMPLAKALSDSEEAYYLEHGSYTNDKAKLDVTSTDTNAQVTLGNDEELQYVKLSRGDIKNNLVMYQRHSPRFAGHVHCEAVKEDAQAEWLCSTALHGQLLDGGLSGEAYHTYLLEGNVGEKDYFAKACPIGGETQSCSCGEGLRGICNDKEGSWSYEGECPTPLADKIVACGTGYTGNKTRKAQCNGNNYEYGDWDESQCIKNCVRADNMCVDAVTLQYGCAAECALQFAQLAASYKSKIWFCKKGACQDAKSVLFIMGAGLVAGTEVTIKADGPDDQKAVAALTAFLSSDDIATYR